MHRHFARLAAVLLALSLSALAPGPARAAVTPTVVLLPPVPEPPADSAKGAAPDSAKAAAPDSSRLLPRWLHAHAAAGLGWLASPAWMRKFYQAGQGYELGFETQPASGFRLRLNGEYQMLPIVTTSTYTVVTSVPGLNSEPTRDTLQLRTTGQGWIGSGRLEAQVRLTPHMWAVAGVGRGYLETGLHPIHEANAFETLDLDFPGSSSWLWLTTLGGTYEFDFLGPLLATEVRWSGLHHGQVRPQDRMGGWSIRIGWSGF